MMSQYRWSVWSVLWLGLFVTGIAVAGEFEDGLKAAGISEDVLPKVVQTLKENGFTSIQELSQLTEEDTKEMKKALGVNNAKILLEKFGKKAVDKLSLPDLLKYLVNQPQNKDAQKALALHQEVRMAENKTKDWAIVTEENKLDVDFTLSYLEFLVNAAPVAVYRGKTATSIYDLGKEGYVHREHPILNEVLGKDGVDSKGNNWLTVPVEVRKALLWAKATKHSLFPSNPEKEVRTYYNEALKNEGVVKDIVSEYKAALKNREQKATFVNSLKLPE